jgi:type II secretory pathway pseudopilin PulG
MKNRKNFKKGFSLLEILVAGFVFSSGVVAVMALMVNSLNYSIDSRNKVIASQLAQEGIELVRNIRDNGILVLGASDYSINVDSNIPKNKEKCRISYDSNFLDCSDAFVDFKLYLNDDGFYEAYTADPFATATDFTRKIKTSSVTTSGTNIERITVTSFVSWNGQDIDISNCNPASKCIYIEDFLTN